MHISHLSYRLGDSLIAGVGPECTEVPLLSIHLERGRAAASGGDAVIGVRGIGAFAKARSERGAPYTSRKRICFAVSEFRR